jgi:hypothetical protein
LHQVTDILGASTSDIEDNVELRKAATNEHSTETSKETKLETQETKLAQATLKNGTVIESENFEAGQEVFIVTEDEKVALPVGEYELEDGETLVVEEEGIIASIGAAEEAPEEEVEAKEGEIYATKEELKEVLSLVEEIKSMLESKELSKEENKEEVQQEKEEKQALSVQEPVKKITHNPESKNQIDLNIKRKRTDSTLSRAMARIANINN